MIFRLDTVAQQNLMRRDNWFTLGIDVNGKPFLDFYSGDGWKTITGKNALEAGKWYRLSFVINGSGMGLYLDGRLLASLNGFNPRSAPSSDLFVGCYGDWDDFVLLGKGQSVDGILQQSTSGSWEKKINLGVDQTVRFIEVTAAKREYEHSISVSVAFAETEDDLPYSPAWSWTIEAGDNRLLFPRENGLIHGPWMRIRVNMSAMSWDRTLPLVDYLRVVTRDVATPQDSTYEDEPQGYVALHEEERVPEDLSGVLTEIRRLKAFEKEIRRATHAWGGFSGVVHRVRNNWRSIKDLYGYTFKDPTTDEKYLGNPVALGIFAHQRIDALEKAVDDKVNGLYISLWAHEAKTAGIHGAPENGAVAWTDQPD